MSPPRSSQMSPEEVRAFVEEVLRTGFALTDLLGRLVDALPEDAYPGENHADVVVGMLAGTVMPVAEAAGPRALREASALVAALLDAAISDLRTAARLARRR